MEHKCEEGAMVFRLESGSLFCMNCGEIVDKNEEKYVDEILP